MSVKQFLGTPVTDYLPALGLLVLTAGYLATAYQYSPDARAVPAGDPGKMADRKHYTALKQIGAVAWVFSFALAMLFIGILYAVPLYVFASLFLRGRRSLLLSAGTAALATAMIWILFAAILRLELYPGMLFGGV